MTNVCCSVCGKPMDYNVLLDVLLKGTVRNESTNAFVRKNTSETINALLVANKAQVVHDDCLHEQYVNRDDGDAIAEANIPPERV